ncbi:MAG: hypothetical protein IPG24_04970 [Leptospiraceae bacterium]|nr:hypothetical protein [Leptospiraceae bacterium]
MSAIANMKDRTDAKELTGPIFSDLNGAPVMNQNYQTFIDYFKINFP